MIFVNKLLTMLREIPILRGVFLMLGTLGFVVPSLMILLPHVDPNIKWLIAMIPLGISGYWMFEGIKDEDKVDLNSRSPMTFSQEGKEE